MKKTLYLGDNIESLKKLEDNSVDAIVTDPPYGLSFMNKRWDYDVPSVELWKEVYRVLKPGGHVLSFGGTRTYHRMVLNIEDAGFEIRDMISWMYGSGFPKSLNVGKAIDATIKTGKSNPKSINKSELSKEGGEVIDVLQPNNGILGDKKLVNKKVGADLETEQAKEWEGFGSALKPAVEPICLARKPLSEKSIADNVLKWGTGGINIDGCRIGFNDDKPNQINCKRNKQEQTGWASMGTLADRENPYIPNSEGRFPANVILECICDEVIKGEKGEVRKSNGRIRENHNYNSVGNMGSYDGEGTIDNYNDKGDIHTNPDCPCYMLDKQSGVSESKKGKPRKTINFNQNTKIGGGECNFEYNDKGGASRFFYQAKVSKKERNMGLDAFEKKDITDGSIRSNSETGRAFGANRMNKTNTHPTLKPVALMAYLCRLITPPNGVILDPFMGSGSTGIAALLEGFDFIGMEMEKEYLDIAETRIENFELYREFLKK